MNFCKRSYRPILRYLYTEVKKRRGKILLHKHFNNNTDFYRGGGATALGIVAILL